MLYPETKGRALEDMDGLFGRVDGRAASVLVIDDLDGPERERADDGEDEVRRSLGSGEEDDPLLG